MAAREPLKISSPSKFRALFLPFFFLLDKPSFACVLPEDEIETILTTEGNTAFASLAKRLEESIIYDVFSRDSSAFRSFSRRSLSYNKIGILRVKNGRPTNQASVQVEKPV